MASSQRPYGKNRAQPDFLLLGHVQSPDRDNRDNQNHEIAHNIDDAGADKHGVFIKACFSHCNFFGFADAFGRDSEDKGERVEKIPVEDEPDTGVALGVSISSFIQTKTTISRFLGDRGNKKFLPALTGKSCYVRCVSAQEKI